MLTDGYFVAGYRYPAVLVTSVYKGQRPDHPEYYPG
jgi:hypothetical protein